jgi:alkanesulfonate monooxygenase SsuD/methylene tetrahydromethanopterin reductase-like flavin-dependent oxidoreductase (luciferase family)
MKVGLYFDLRNPPLWRQDSSRLYGFTLEMCEEAERLGAHSIWLTEHHLFEDGYMSQPLTFAAAVAARTRRVRIGTGIVMAPLHPAISIAEQATVVDLISGGRLELGLGSGYRAPEFELYGADLTKRFGTTLSRAREIRQLWADPRVTPLRAQDHIPIWLGFAGPKNVRRAGELGEGLLALDPRLYAPYQEGLIAGGHSPTIARMGGMVNAWITDDPDEDWPKIARYAHYWIESYRRAAVEGTSDPAPPPVDMDQLRTADITRGWDMFGDCHIPITTPEDAARQLRDYLAGLPVEQIYFWASYAGMPEAMVARNVQMICTRLAPLLRSW